MPYRRLPNTDLARLRALNATLKKGTQLSPVDLAFSQKSLIELKSFFPHFEQTIFQYKNSRKRQSILGKLLQGESRSAKLYVSHFLQVVNFCILRGEFKPEIRSFYGIDESEKSVPEIGTEQQLIYWGEKLLSGEEKRTLTGATRIYNPSIAMVRVKYEKFLETYNLHKDILNTSQKIQEKVNESRIQADRLISDLWNEIEATFNDLPPEEKRLKCGEYGLVYFYRPSEKKDNERTISLPIIEDKSNSREIVNLLKASNL